MSWDLFVMRLPIGIKSMDEIPKHFRPDPIGTRDSLIAAISAVAPSADFSDPSWGFLEGDEFSIEFNMGNEQEVDSFALHVRGGDLAIGVVADLLERLDVGAVDPQSDSGIFDRESSVESLRRWRAYRDRVVGS